ncbi:MAG: hypothetical protein AAGA85_15220 [Bacteroidota bacterium]
MLVLLPFWLKAQTVEVQEFVFEGIECPDFISFDPDFRVQMTTLLKSRLAAVVGASEVTFGSTGDFAYRAGDLESDEPVKNQLDIPKGGPDQHYASIVSYFKGSSYYADEGTIGTYVNLKTRVLVLNSKGKRIYKGLSSIPAQIDTQCRMISDSWIAAEDFKGMLSRGVAEAFDGEQPGNKRLVLRCGRSIPMHDRLARLDSFEVRKGQRQISAVVSDSIFSTLKLDLGGKDPELIESFHGWDVRKKMRQDGLLIDGGDGREYQVSIIRQKVKRPTANDSTKLFNTGRSIVRYYHDGNFFSEFRQTPSGSIKGLWQGEIVVVGVDYDGLVNYYIDNRWAALSKYFPADSQEGDKFALDVFYCKPDLSDYHRRLLVKAMLTFDLSQAITLFTPGG